MTKKYLYVGNRPRLLKNMIAKGLDIVGVFTPENSLLAHECANDLANLETFSDKQTLVEKIRNAEFDLLVSNGCAYILPVSMLKKQHQEFVNIHPSLLPDLRGNHPVNGAILFDRPSAGATCHIMDDGVDTGPVLSRVEIPLTPDIDLGLLYQLSFLAEEEVFWAAHRNAFRPLSPTPSAAGKEAPIYYTRKPQDMAIDFAEDAEAIVRRVKAFSIPSQRAHFSFQGHEFHVRDAAILTNPYLMNLHKRYSDFEIAFRYDDTIVLRKADQFLKLSLIEGELHLLEVGSILCRNH